MTIKPYICNLLLELPEIESLKKFNVLTYEYITKIQFHHSQITLLIPNVWIERMENEPLG